MIMYNYDNRLAEKAKSFPLSLHFLSKFLFIVAFKNKFHQFIGPFINIAVCDFDDISSARLWIAYISNIIGSSLSMCMRTCMALTYALHEPRSRCVPRLLHSISMCFEVKTHDTEFVLIISADSK